jgi:hypothetical protein
MSTTIDFTDGKLGSSVKTAYEEILSFGDIPIRVHDYLRGTAKREPEVDVDTVTDDPDELQRQMWRYLKGRGVRMDKQVVFNEGGYDEILFSAFDRAARVISGGDDRFDKARSADGFSDDSAWDFKVETFDTLADQGISPESIRAAGAIDYIFEFGERMGVFQLAEALVLNWSSGIIDVSAGAAAGKLYRYWKLIDDRSDADERGMLYRRVLNKGGAKVLSRMVVNEGYPQIWSSLMNEIARYIDKSEQVEQGRREFSPVSAAPIYEAVRELQYNLTEYCNGMAFMQARELYATLQQAFDILRDPDIVAYFGGPRRRNMWRVIEEMSKRDLRRSVPIGPLVRVAIDGNKIYQLCADFDEGSVNQDWLLALVDAGEAYIINSSIVDGQLGGATNGGIQEDEEDDDFGNTDDFAEDEFEDV